MLLSVDEGLGRIMTTLDSLGILDNTLIVLSSDNGFFFGEHGLTSERRLPYEESIRNALLMRYPPRIPAGARPDGLVLTVDLAPTALDAAGVGPVASVQGRSVLPLFTKTPSDWRQSVLVEFYTNEQPFPHLLDVDYRAIRTQRYKYIHWVKHPCEDELYDLRADPHEQRNLAGERGSAAIRQQMRNELGVLVLNAVGLDSP